VVGTYTILRKFKTKTKLHSTKIQKTDSSKALNEINNTDEIKKIQEEKKQEKKEEELSKRNLVVNLTEYSNNKK
jgi:hypothetical protein